MMFFQCLESCVRNVTLECKRGDTTVKDTDCATEDKPKLVMCRYDECKHCATNGDCIEKS